MLVFKLLLRRLTERTSSCWPLFLPISCPAGSSIQLEFFPTPCYAILYSIAFCQVPMYPADLKFQTFISHVNVEC